MRKYETVVVVSGEAAEAKQISIIEKLVETIKKAEGSLLKIEDWGKKTLAFEVKKQSRGYYTLMEYAGGGAIVAAIERQCSLAEEVLLFQSIRLTGEAGEQEIAAAENVVAEYLTARAAKKAAAAEEEKAEAAPGPFLRPAEAPEVGAGAGDEEGEESEGDDQPAGEEEEGADEEGADESGEDEN